MPGVRVWNPRHAQFIADPQVTTLIQAPQTIAHHREGGDPSALKAGLQSDGTGVRQRVDNTVGFEVSRVKFLERENPLAQSIVEGASNAHIARLGRKLPDPVLHGLHTRKLSKDGSNQPNILGSVGFPRSDRTVDVVQRKVSGWHLTNITSEARTLTTPRARYRFGSEATVG